MIDFKEFLRSISLVFLVFFCLIGGAAAMANETKFFSWVEQVEVNQDGRFLVRGIIPSQMPADMEIKSTDKNVNINSFVKKKYEDGRVFFKFEVVSPKFNSGGYFPLKLAFEGNGEYYPLTLRSGAEIFLHVPKVKRRHWFILIAVVIAVGLGFSRKFQAVCAKFGLWVECHQRKLAWGIGVAALVLVAAGWTGSSWQLFVNTFAGQSFLEVQGSQWQIRSSKLDRWDEWGVITPSVIAQWNHEPRFPIVNKNIGLEGQNMGVIGMFGVPIFQPAALARPATWGYFLLPFRQAMSWQWQIQFWGCLLALWWLLNILQPAQAGRNLALSLGFCMVPYAAGWSNWPLYASLFPVLGVSLMTKLLTLKKFISVVLVGVVIGWVFASWVLVLYPPWLVIVGSLCMMLLVGWVIDNRKDLVWGAGQWFGLLSALLVAGGLLGSWWIDTRDAVMQVQATVYPGGRQTEVGGTAPLIWALRGYLGLEIFASHIGVASNKPEASSYFFVPLAMVAILLWGAFKAQRSRGLWCALAAFVAIYGWYSFVGFPVWLAQVTKWGVLTTNRMDLGLGLALVVLVCLLQPSSLQREKDSKKRLASTVVGVSLAVASALLAWWVLMHVSPDLMPFNSLPYRIAIVLLCAAMAWWMWCRQTVGLTLVLLVTGFGAAFTYTPTSKAPKAVWLSDAVKPYVMEAGKPARTLVVDSDSLPAMTLAALGIPVINGPLYYPHRSMWKSMQLPEDQWPVVNRYQHLTFMPAKNLNESLHYRVISSRMDAVTVFFDPRVFDFASTGAQRVVSHEALASMLDESPHLERMGVSRQYVWFRVK